MRPTSSDVSLGRLAAVGRINHLAGEGNNGEPGRAGCVRTTGTGPLEESERPQTTGNRGRSSESADPMSLRQMGVVVPLAVLVAVLAHLAGFGADHAPGAAHAHGLLASLAAGLALSALATLLLGALRPHRRDRTPWQQERWLPMLLAGGGALAYASIEAVEGRFWSHGTVRSLVAIVPVAVVVWRLARCAATMLRSSGAALAAIVASAWHSSSSLTWTPARRPVRAR